MIYIIGLSLGSLISFVIDYFDQYLNVIQNIPILIIESDNDPLILPELQQKLKELYVEAQVYTFKDEGHFPYVNAAEEYNSRIQQFFKSEDN